MPDHEINIIKSRRREGRCVYSFSNARPPASSNDEKDFIHVAVCLGSCLTRTRSKKIHTGVNQMPSHPCQEGTGPRSRLQVVSFSGATLSWQFDVLLHGHERGEIARASKDAVSLGGSESRLYLPRGQRWLLSETQEWMYFSKAENAGTMSTAAPYLY